MKDRAILDYMALVRESIHKEYNGEKYDYTDTDWMTVLRYASDTKMLPIMAKRIKECPGAIEKAGPTLDRVTGMFIKYAIHEMQKKSLLKKLVATAKEQDIPVLLFKGVVLSCLYPEPSLRLSSDTDMYIDESERDRMAELLLYCGYNFHEEDSNENVVKYLHPSGHYIELHSKLWSFIKGTRIDELQNMGLTDCRVHGVYDGIECDTIAYGEQLVFLMFHLYKHIMFEHANFRFIVDILLFMYAYADGIDFVTLKERFEFLGYWNCFCNIYGIGLRYLGFEPLAVFEAVGIEEYDEEAADTLIEELLLIDIEDEDEEFRFELTYSMTPYLTGDADGGTRKGANGSALSYLFPSYSNFPEEYTYVHKCPILLPVGWIHRIIKYVWDTRIARKHRMTGTTRMKKVDEKVNKLKKMKMI